MEILYTDEENIAGENINNMRIIEASNISFSFENKRIFSDISFSIGKGEKTAVTGENGSGKSTLIRILCGLLKDYKGSIKINGDELNSISMEKWRDCFTFVTQDPYLFEGTVIENINIGNPAADMAAVLDIMDMLGIKYIADSEVLFNDKTLSGGTDLIMFDEPSNNLDRETSEWLCNFIMNSTKTLLFISHDSKLISTVDSQIIM